MINRLPVRRVSGVAGHGLDSRAWPMTLAPVRQLIEGGVDLDPVTVLVGENGTGKSTIVEAIAMAYGLSSEGGSTGALHSTRATESDLWESLLLERSAGLRKWGYFLRAETMHGLYSYLEDHPGKEPDPDFHRLSHGESFMAMLATRRFQKGGFFVLDEPEAGLSFVSQLTLIGQLAELVAEGRTQLVIATHSPVLARLPGARLLQLDERGITEVGWDELAVVDHYRAFLADPDVYLHHLLPSGTLFSKGPDTGRR
ncbi:AAA family ATPase [Microlunatus endophyticus]|uniref:AAA family ATPase n=1 Tax=Microlunatus endophyticus TaxID=1716077 RepID=UPI001E3DE66B|nr:AAA family ATPase [Microlunatus endophyticus]